MRKIIMFGTALILIGVGAWAVDTTHHVAASTQIGIDPFQMMVNAKNLSTSHYVY